MLGQRGIRSDCELKNFTLTFINHTVVKKTKQKNIFRVKLSHPVWGIWGRGAGWYHCSLWLAPPLLLCQPGASPEDKKNIPSCRSSSYLFIDSALNSSVQPNIINRDKKALPSLCLPGQVWWSKGWCSCILLLDLQRTEWCSFACSLESSEGGDGTNSLCRKDTQTDIMWPGVREQQMYPVQVCLHLSARTSSGAAPWAQLRIIQAESRAARNPRATPVPIGQKGCKKTGRLCN